MTDKVYDVYHQEIELTEEQNACLKYSGDRTLMVKGYAGAGKSLVLMVIAQKYLAKYGKDAKNKVAFFTFQNTLVSTMCEFLKVNDQQEDGVVVSTINHYVKEIYELLVRNGVAPKCRYPFNGKNGEELRLNNVKKALSDYQVIYGKHRFHDVDLEFWLEEFDWMKNMNVWTDDLDYYLTIPRKGRGGKIRMSSADRVTAYRIFSFYWGHLEKTGQGDWADQSLFIVRHPELIPEEMKFEHILIDEAQDLSLAQMTAIMMLYKTDMIVAMDMNQRIHNRYWTPKLLGIEATTKKLTKSMRTTVQIDALAESVRNKNDINLAEDDRSLRAIPEREGRIPKIVHLEDQAAERKYVVSLVRRYLEENSKITIGIIASKNKQINMYSDWLTSAGIKHERITKDDTFHMASPGVKIVTAFGAKGLEFDCVIIPLFVEGCFPYSFYSDDQETMNDFMVKMRNLVYVSMTRAKHVLTITFWGKGSRFIGEMDPAMYEWEGEPFKVPIINTGFVENKKNTETSIPGSSDMIQMKPQQKSDVSKNQDSNSGLMDFMIAKGLEVIDKRSKGGALWVVGDKGIDPIIKESRVEFGALWVFCEKGGGATKHRPGWFTKSSK